MRLFVFKATVSLYVSFLCICVYAFVSLSAYIYVRAGCLYVRVCQSYVTGRLCQPMLKPLIDSRILIWFWYKPDEKMAVKRLIDYTSAK